LKEESDSTPKSMESKPTESQENTNTLNRVLEVLPIYSPSNSADKHGIFVFGLMGWGKSSFLNTCLIATKAQTFAKTFEAYNPNAANSVTTVYDRYQIPGTNIFLYDTYGWEVNPTSNYTVQQFKNFLHGLYPLRKTQRGANIQESPYVDHDISISAVIFVIQAEFLVRSSPSSLPDLDNLWKSSGSQPGLGDFYRAAINMGKKVVFLVSKVDLVKDGALVTSYTKYSDLCASSEWENLKAYIVAMLDPKDESTVVLPLISYPAAYLNTPKVRLLYLIFI
jgi:hypothetical protein